MSFLIESVSSFSKGISPEKSVGWTVPNSAGDDKFLGKIYSKMFDLSNLWAYSLRKEGGLLWEEEKSLLER